MATRSSSVADIKQVVPDAKLIEATPDLVGLADVADDLMEVASINMQFKPIG